MKNACKRLFSLMLALVLLVSIVPFQALAAETDAQYFLKLTVDKYEAEGGEKVKSELGVEGWGSVTPDQELTEWADAYNVAEEGYEFDGWYYWDGSNEHAIEDATIEDAAVLADDGTYWVDMYAKLVKSAGGDDTDDTDDTDGDVPPAPTKYTIAVYVNNEWKKNIEVEENGVVADADLAEFEKEGYTLTWTFSDGSQFIPGKTQVTGDWGIGANYEEKVTKHSVAVYVDGECVETLWVKHGESVSKSDLAKYAEDGYELTWETNGATFIPGETKVKSDMAIGAVYTRITKYTVTTSVDTYDEDGEKEKDIIKKYDSNVKGTDSLSKYAKDCGGDRTHSKYDCKWFYWDGANEYSIEGKTVADAAVNGKVDLYAKHTLKEHAPEHDENVVITFKYDGKTIGEPLYKDGGRHPEDYMDKYDIRKAQSLMEEALNRDEEKAYELDVDKDGRDHLHMSVTERRGVYYYTISLNKIRVKSNLKLTLYVYDYSDKEWDRMFRNEETTVYSDEEYKHDDDVFAWINRAQDDDRHYSAYDYDIDRDKSDYDRDDNELTVYLKRRHRDDDDRKIYLQVYINGDKTSYAKKLTITNSRYITDDGELDIDEAIKIVREYFVPKNSEKDMNFDGLWLQGRDKVFDHDEEHDSIHLQKHRDRHETATVVIMANNARLKNNSTNPKTGDEILVAVTVMAVSATALAAAYVLNKKRMAK